MAIVNLDKVLSGVNGNLEHIVLYSDIDSEVLEKKYPNGTFVTLGELAGLGGEAKKAKRAEHGDADILMAHAPELSYDEKTKLRDFRNEEGSVTRAYRPSVGDIYSFTTDILPSGVAVGDKLVVKAGKLAKDDTVLEEASLVLQVFEDMKYEVDTEEKAFALQVVKIVK